MSEFTVNMTGYISGTIRVEADNPDDAIEEAQTEGLPPICAQCSGWGKPWSKEEGDEWTEISVTDAEGNTVWTGPSPIEQRMTTELDNLAELIEAAPSVAQAAMIVRKRIGQIESTR